MAQPPGHPGYYGGPYGQGWYYPRGVQQAPPQWGTPAYPYAPDPRYVGPAWAAPGPYRQVPRRSSGGSGCLIAVLVVMGVLGAMVAVPIVLVVLFAASEGDDRPPRPGVDDGPMVYDDSKPTTVPFTPGITTTAPVPQRDLGVQESSAARNVRTTGTCMETSSERYGSVFEARRERGSAPHLRGRVAILHLRVGGGRSSWPSSLDTRIDEAAVVAHTFYQQQAAARSIGDVTVEMIPWSLPNAPLDMPALVTDSHKSLDVYTQRLLRTRARSAIEGAVGFSLESVVASYKAKGYDAVAFLVYLPTGTLARDFAWYASRNDPPGDPEIAILFPQRDQLAQLAVTVSHEALHLFGAYDLYRLRTVGSDDVHDIMGEYCTGLRQARVGDATAYAIGWRPTPPARPYSIQDR